MNGAIIDPINLVSARFNPPISYYPASRHCTGDITDLILTVHGPNACCHQSTRNHWMQSLPLLCCNSRPAVVRHVA